MEIRRAETVLRASLVVAELNAQVQAYEAKDGMLWP